MWEEAAAVESDDVGVFESRDDGDFAFETLVDVIAFGFCAR